MSRLRWLFALALAGILIPDRAAAQERVPVAVQVTEAGTQRPLPGVLIEIPGLRLSALTDEAGRAVLQATRGTHTLRISHIGYKQTMREVVAQSAVTVTINLETDPLRLDELVVTGYTMERRRHVTGAITSVKPETTKEIPVAQIQEVLRGRAPGVQVVQNSGTPGSAMTVRIRGSASINGGNDPLYVIDGVPMTQGNWSRLGGFGGQGIDAVGDLNPNEIESIEILKDASAAAIYGSRASNGVVLVTTKKGKTGRPDITFGAYYGTQQDWRRVDMLNAAQYIEVYNEGCVNRYGAPCVTYVGEPNATTPVPSSVANNMKAYRNVDTNWLDEVLRDGSIANLEASIRGGTDRVRYYVSGSSLDQEGTQLDLGYKKLNARVNLDYNPADRLTLGTNVSLTRSIAKRAANDNTIQGGLANAIAIAPTVPVKDANGRYVTGFYTNPVGNIANRSAEDRNVRILGNVFGTYALLEGINLRASAGLDHLNLRGLRYNSPAYGSAAATGGFGTDANTYVTKVTYEGTVNFNRLLGTNHEFAGVAGTSYEDNSEAWGVINGEQFPNEFFKFIASAATTYGNSGREDWGLVSYFGRLSYTWRDRVTTSFNVRRDGSSRFGENNRFGTFPSVSLNWRIGDESFMQGQNILGNLSLRASYGITGNQQSLDNYQWRAVFNGGANYMDQPGISPARLGNPDLRWEKTKQFNVGTDFSILSNRLKIAFDYYVKETEDLLWTLPLPRSTGFAGITSNVGSMENRGLDLGLTADWLTSAGDGLDFSTTLSLSRNRNKVIELYNNTESLGSTGTIKEGYPLAVFWGYVADGIFQSYDEIAAHATQVTNSNPRLATAPGDIRFKDLDGNGVINTADRTLIGNPWPDFEGGVTNTASFKGFDMTAFVSFSQGNDIYNGTRFYMDRYGSDGDNHSTRALNRWRPDNTNTKEPRAIWGDPNQNTRASTRWVEDGSYWRLKNLVVGYTLRGESATLAAGGQRESRGIPRLIGARSIRFYVQGQNLITNTDYQGFDPEVNSAGNSSTTRGWDFYGLPQPRTLTFGFNVVY
jgi:TonB-linked SusC/RagA family outer membrane protein